ncbi:MAG: queuosine precursor transporter, partial [Spirochaetia bacterium]
MSNELFWAVMLLANFVAIIGAYRLWGRLGLFIWVPAAVIIANIQVTKTVELFGITATLGNIVYASSFLVTDILSENYGKKDAGRAVGIGFFSLILFTLLMNLALLFDPAPGDFVHESMSTIFGFMPRIVAASLA